MIQGQDLTDQGMVLNCGWRVVMNPRRAKKLRSRGEDIRWSNFFMGWIWDFNGRANK